MRTNQPTHILILGGGGDLAQRKLLPSLFNLFIQELLPPTFYITGLARTERTNSEYRAFVKKTLLNAFSFTLSESKVDSFCEKIGYVTGSFTEKESYNHLREEIETFENIAGVPTDKLFYLAVPPQYYEEIFIMLNESKLASLSSDTSQWARILVEKPFGSNYITAQKLDKTLSSLFSEEQIFRIDHYLAKEAVQNILSFRFANTFFKSPWNNTSIKEVRITMHESIDVGSRGSFYDEVGALRDVGQNHLLQILALIAMDEPRSLTAQDIRVERAAILEKLVEITELTSQTSIVRGQYDGYKDTVGVKENSTTETYFEFKASINTDVWEGVPFYVSAGKGLQEDKVCVEIIFHDVATGPFETSECTTVGNSILLTISPEHSMSITLNTKKPGHGYHIESRALSYTWDDAVDVPVNAYEKVLLDCIGGDQTLFTRTEEVLASWKFITSIMENCHLVPLQTYKKGSAGPEETFKK